MRCDPKAVSTYISGDLPRATHQRMEAHLAECDACRVLASEYGQIRALIKSLPTHVVPDVVELGVRRGMQRNNLHGGWAPPFRVMAAAAAVVVLSFLVGYGVLHQRLRAAPDAQPVVVESLAGTQTVESVEGTVVKIVFDHPMDPASVADAINISPPVPTKQPRWKEEGKVLEIPVEPERTTTYRVSIDNTARDNQGNTLKQNYELEFSTDPRGLVAAPPPPSPTSTMTAKVSPSPSGATYGIAALPAFPLSSAVTSTVESEHAKTATPSVTATWHSASLVTATPVGQMANSSPVTPVPVTSPAVTTTLTPAACPAPDGAFAPVYAQNPTLRASLGCSSQTQKDIAMVSQPLQHGMMLWRDDTRHVYVLWDSGKWSEFPDTWKEGDPYSGDRTPPVGMYKPIRGFGKVWQEQSGLRDSLGWATEMEHGFTAPVQQLARGVMLLIDQSWVYVLSQDETWQRFRAPAD